MREGGDLDPGPTLLPSSWQTPASNRAKAAKASGFSEAFRYFSGAAWFLNVSLFKNHSEITKRLFSGLHSIDRALT